MKVLVIEDDPDLAEVLVSMLEDQGYRVDTAADGIKGLERALEWACDLIVLDVMIPGINGYEVLRGLRLHKLTPVLILTSLSGTAERVTGLDLGADDYLTKPFEHLELLARVRALMRRSGLTAKQVLEVGAIKIDTGSKQVNVNEKPVELTTREFDLAVLMMRQRGKVLSREYLFEQMFESDELSHNLLDVYIYKLRQKLGSKFIRTRRGSGYLVE